MVAPEKLLPEHSFFTVLDYVGKSSMVLDDALLIALLYLWLWCMYVPFAVCVCMCVCHSCVCHSLYVCVPQYHSALGLRCCGHTFVSRYTATATAKATAKLWWQMRQPLVATTQRQ
jgi:hypothetical protein